MGPLLSVRVHSEQLQGVLMSRPVNNISEQLRDPYPISGAPLSSRPIGLCTRQRGGQSGLRRWKQLKTGVALLIPMLSWIEASLVDASLAAFRRALTGLGTRG